MVYQTLFFVLFTTMFIQSGALLASWRLNPHEVGLRDWGAAQLIMALGAALAVVAIVLAGKRAGGEVPLAVLLLRDVGAVFGNTGWILAWQAVRRFYHKPAFSYWLVPGWALFTGVVMVPGTYLPGWRVGVIGVVIGICSAMIVWEIFRARQESRFVTWTAGLSMAAVTLAWLARAASSFADLERTSGAAAIDLACTYTGIVMSTVFTFSLILMTNQRIHQQLRDQAAEDPLTGALNRRAFFDASKPIMATLRREPVGLAVAVVDIDHFKTINDRYGHAVGDEVLARFSAVARATLRESDLFARYGGEEFVILMQHTDDQAAVLAVERLRGVWDRETISAGGDTLRVTFSAGIRHAAGPLDVSLDDLLKAADQALYGAKRRGRNRTVLSSEPLAAGAFSPLPGEA